MLEPKLIIGLTGAMTTMTAGTFEPSIASEIFMYLGGIAAILGIGAKWFDSITRRMEVKSAAKAKNRELDIEQQKIDKGG